MKTISKIFLSLMIVGILAVILVMFIIIDIKSTLNVGWRNNDLHIYSFSDEHFIVTHLIYREFSGHKTAELIPPLIITDSAGRYLSNEEFEKLTWIDYLGEPVTSPPLGCDIAAIYYRPKQTIFISDKEKRC